MISKIKCLTLLLFSIFLIALESFSVEKQKEDPRKLDFEYLNVAVQEKGMHVWGSSPVLGKDGKIHLYVAEWPMPKDPAEKFSGWYKHSRIVHYIGDSPEGPFELVRTAVPDQDGVFNSPHNPTVQYIDGLYVLCFIVNEHNDLRKQRIIMYVSDDLTDNWRPAKGAAPDGTILTATKDTAIWNYGARLGVSNPSLIKHRGHYMLYYKSVVPDFQNPDDRNSWDYGYGVADSEDLEGPYQCNPNRVTDPGIELEDAYAFTLNGEVYMLSRDMEGSMGTRGGGLLWHSANGYTFLGKNTQRAYEDLAFYFDKDALENVFVFRGSKGGDLERPQLLKIDGKPAYLYMATGINTKEGFGSASHIFKLKGNNGSGAN